MNHQTGIKDYLWLFIIAIAILAFSSIPYWAARSAETDKLLFRGAYFDEMDYAVHISMMQAGRMGDWAYEIRFTSEDHNPAFLRMFYIILGHISKWVNISVETTYHTARWIFGFIALFSIYQLCRNVFQEKMHARTAFLLCTIGGGAGLLQLLFNSGLLKSSSPIDFWLIDAYIFFSISVFPSFSYSLALMAAALNLYLGYLITGNWKAIVFICLIAILSQITNPIAFAVIDIACAGATFFLWWKDKRVKLHQFYALGAIAAAQIPLFVYNFFILDRDPFWSQFTFQNQTLSPPPSYLVWGFSPFWLLAIYGMTLAIRGKNLKMVTMSIWTISGIVLAYLPLSIQRRFLLGYTIPLGILAIYGLSHLIRLISIKLPKIMKRERLIYFAYIASSAISFIYLVFGASLFMQTLPAANFYPRDLENALVWLNENAQPDDFVLAGIQTSQLVAQRTSLRVYAGHPIETLNFESKKSNMRSYYQGNSPENWLTQTHANWVIYGPYEKEISSSFAQGSELEMAYKNESVIIYKVEK